MTTRLIFLTAAMIGAFLAVKTEKIENEVNAGEETAVRSKRGFYENGFYYPGARPTYWWWKNPCIYRQQTYPCSSYEICVGHFSAECSNGDPRLCTACQRRFKYFPTTYRDTDQYKSRTQATHYNDSPYPYQRNNQYQNAYYNHQYGKKL